MNFTYETQGANTYLVYEITAEDEVDSMSLGMLTNNKVPGFAPTFIQQMDMTKYIKYNISAKVSVKQFFTGVVNRKRLLGVFTGIVNAMLQAEDYMLETETILLDLDYIYVDVSNCDTVLICLPVAGARAPIDFGGFFKNIIFTTQFDQSENCDHVARIINYLNSMPVFSMVDFKKVLDELNQQQNMSVAGQQPILKSEPVRPVTPQQTVPQQGNRVTPQQPAAPTMSQQTSTPRMPQQPAAPAILPQASTPRMPQQTTKPRKEKKGKTEKENAPSFMVPNRETENAEPEMSKNATDSEEKISLFYLMQHYNKENAAKYKAQKEEKKSTGKKSKKGQVSADMEIPGMTMPPQSRGGGIPVPPQNSGTMPIPPQNRDGVPVPPSGHRTMQQMKQPVQPQQSTPIVQPVQPQQSTPIVKPVQPQQNAPIAPPVSGVADRYAGIVTSAANFGETVVLNAGKAGETTVLNGNIQQNTVVQQSYLVRKKTGERVLLDKPVFRIGKERSYVDYFIGDNPAISRGHANIILRDGEYFVIDTNSTNHTYVNGEMIQSNLEVRIVLGDTIRFADEEFEFKIF